MHNSYRVRTREGLGGAGHSLKYWGAESVSASVMVAVQTLAEDGYFASWNCPAKREGPARVGRNEAENEEPSVMMRA